MKAQIFSLCVFAGTAYAFDIDEAVDLTLTYVPELTTAQALVVMFDKSGGDGRGSMKVVPGARFCHNCGAAWPISAAEDRSTASDSQSPPSAERSARRSSLCTCRCST